MSSDDSSNANATSDRRDAVREKALLVQATQARSRRIRTATIVSSVVAVVAVTAVVVTWAVSSAAMRPMLSPSNFTDGGFQVTSVAGVAGEVDATDVAETPTPTPEPSGSASGDATPSPTAPTDQPAVEIRVYVDYLSSGSKDFQLANVQQLTKWVSEDAATLTYYPVAMLTAKSNGTKYSLRAASAAACVATHSPDTFFAYNNALLTQQPDVDSDGLTDAELADIAIATGANSPKVVRTCIEEQQYIAWAKTSTESALQGLPGTDGVALTGAPMVLVNGKPYVGAIDDPAEFAQFILTISSEAFYKETASSTPTPTATPSASPSATP